VRSPQLQNPANDDAGPDYYYDADDGGPRKSAENSVVRTDKTRTLRLNAEPVLKLGRASTCSPATPARSQSRLLRKWRTRGWRSFCDHRHIAFVTVPERSTSLRP